MILVSQTPAADGRPSGLWYGMGAGTVFGLFTVAASGCSARADHVADHLIRGASIAIGGWILARREPWRVARPLWPALVVVGVIDMAATAAYLAAIAIGPLAIAAILASLYPVITTMLAALVLRERISRDPRRRHLCRGRSGRPHRRRHPL